MRIERTVLLIDDDEDDLEMLEEALKTIDGNHKTVQAKDGVDGLRTLETLVEKQSLPCLIVLDINMPKLDGKQTFVAIRSNDALRNIPIVIFSTSSSKLDKTFFDRHNVAYFVKPINLTGLAITASRMINTCYHRANQK
jgi:CheY-like chemotaxis protein